MYYDTDFLETILEENGEIMVVLDSDREYTLHTHDTQFTDGEVMSEGMTDGGEYQCVTFPASAVEHYYTHMEA